MVSVIVIVHVWIALKSQLTAAAKRCSTMLMSCQSIVSAPQRTKWFNENGPVLKQIYKGPVPLLLFWHAVSGCGCVALSRSGSGFNFLASWGMVITKDTVKPGWFCKCPSELIFFILHFWMRQVLHRLIASFRRLTWHVFFFFFCTRGNS